MNTLKEALVLVLAMGLVIFFCRAFPFLFFGEWRRGKNPPPEENGRGAMGAFLNFVERIVPPVAMTVLAFNALGGAFMADHRDGLLVLAASVFTALLHLWKKNFLISILGGTILYTLLI